MPPGTFVTHYGQQVHFDGAKDEEAVLLIVGDGPRDSDPSGSEMGRPPTGSFQQSAELTCGSRKDGRRYFHGGRRRIKVNPPLG